MYRSIGYRSMGSGYSTVTQETWEGEREEGAQRIRARHGDRWLQVRLRACQGST